MLKRLDRVCTSCLTGAMGLRRKDLLHRMGCRAERVSRDFPHQHYSFQAAREHQFRP